jgi:hypothetical protein
MNKATMNEERRSLLKGLGIAATTAVLPAWARDTAAGAAGQRELRIVDDIAPFRQAPRPPAGKDLQAYLLAYFKDETHSLHIATSPDGYVFTDVNGGAPVLDGKRIAAQKGIRDPHIMRGPDNAFYLAMTDLHVYGQREGLRSTQWERPAADYSWGNNRNLVLMKSYDLVHWTHALVDVGRAYPQAGDLGCAWAPETIFDPGTGRLMVYFTTRVKNGPNILVYAYANDTFTGLDSAPKSLFEYPNPKVNVIDADITRVGDKYHMFYVAHDNGGGMRHAVSNRINGGYVYEPGRVDPEVGGAEAPNVWRRLGTDTYVMMFDVFSVNPHNMGFVETKDFVTYKNLGRMNEPGSPMKAINFERPKHGAVMHLTLEERDRLVGHFAAS